MENFNQENSEHLGLGETVPDELLDYPSPNNPPWNSLVAIVLWLLSFIFIGVLQLLFISFYTTSQSLSFSNGEKFKDFALNDPTAILIQLSAVIPAHILTLILAWLIVTNFRKYSFKEVLGWGWGDYKWWQTLLITITLVILVFSLAIVTTLIFGKYEHGLDKILKSSRYAVFLVAILATFSAPIVEEVVYRGVMYSAFQRTFATPFSKIFTYLEKIPIFKALFEPLQKVSVLNKLKFVIESIQAKYHIHLAVLLVTIVFASVHFIQYQEDIATLIMITFVSLLLTMIRVKTNNLLPCIFFHFVINGLQSILLILQPYLPETMDATKVEGFFFSIFR